jgi:predicted transcriptional regulator
MDSRKDIKRQYLERQQQEKLRWEETLQAIESAAMGRIISSEAVHGWLHSWGSEKETDPPCANR